MTDYSPYTPPTANTDREEQHVNHTPLILLAVIASFAYLTGIGDGFLRGSKYYYMYYLGTMIVYIILAISWYQADAHKLGRPRSTGMVFAIVFILAISIPVYLFRSRGAAKGAIATVLFILFYVGCSVLNNLGKITVLGVDKLLS